MAINRKHFAEGFSIFPAWVCPTCQTGTLRSITDARKTVETGPSKSEHSHEAWEPDWIRERFTDLLICSNSVCKQVVAVAGQTSNFLDYYYGPNGTTESELITTLKPIGFVPAPAIFPIHSKVPDEIREQLVSAFSLFWMDREACAGRLRICVELLLDDIKIPRMRIGKSGNKSQVSLDARIKEYGNVDSEASELLLAVKWIGNIGSHASLSRLDRDDLLNVFEILELVLEEAYVGTKKRLASIAKAINSAKGKPAKSK